MKRDPVIVFHHREEIIRPGLRILCFDKVGVAPKPIG